MEAGDDYEDAGDIYEDAGHIDNIFKETGDIILEFEDIFEETKYIIAGAGDIFENAGDTEGSIQFENIDEDQLEIEDNFLRTCTSCTGRCKGHQGLLDRNVKRFELIWRRLRENKL